MYQYYYILQEVSDALALDNLSILDLCASVTEVS